MSTLLSTPSKTPAETALMQLIRDQYGAYIRIAVAGKSIPEAFVAALVANESGGNAGATRYEAAELGRFAQVLTEERKDYQGIGAQSLTNWILRGSFTAKGIATNLVSLCKSWGPTQIMGWHALKGAYPISELQTAEKHFVHTAELLNDFIISWRLHMPDQSKDLFTCWNAGGPANTTSDPYYAVRGLLRMQIYQEL